MSVISTVASSASAANLFVHGHKKGSHSVGQSASSETQAAGSTQGLFSTLLASLEQVIGVSLTAPTSATTAATAASAANSATGATSGTAAASASGATAASKQQMQAFMHTLSQALKADGLGSSPPTPGGTSAAGTSGQYQGSFASSLQTLIGQLQSGTSTATTSNLTTAFNNLVQNTGATTAASGTAATSSTASLQSFLNNMLQSVQNGQNHSVSAVGATVSAKV